MTTTARSVTARSTTAQSMTAQALLITGTVGAGKTTVADAVGDLLSAGPIPNAVLDLDWLSRSWPCPPGDPFNVSMRLRNLRVMARNYLEAGALRLVAAGVVETHEERKLYEEAIGAELTVCRLRADLALVRQRLARRHAGDEARLRWHLDRSGELDTLLEQARVEDVVVETTGSPTAVAAAVLTAVGWI